MNSVWLYKLARPLLVFIIKLYRPTIVGASNIPSSGRCLLVGNHTSALDALLVGVSTKRCVHFLAKDELMKGFKRHIFKNMGIIPVNRRGKDSNALKNAITCLKEEELVAIFPEGTINKTKDLIMPFKYGAVKIAHETKCVVIPFAITKKYQILKKSVKIEFSKPYIIEDDDLDIENKKLMKKVINLMVKKG